MKQLPSMPIDTTAFLAATGHLNDGEIGCHALLLMATWMSADCRLLADRDVLARICRVRPSQWKRRWKAIHEFWDIEGRHLVPSAVCWRQVDWRLHPCRWARAEWRDIRMMVLGESPACAYCGDTDGPFDVDHIVPRSKGGTNAIDNLTVACRACNRSKGAKDVKDWLAATY